MHVISAAFLETITRGFVEKGGDSDTAVCVLPGTELAFDEAVRVGTTTPTYGNLDGTTVLIGAPPQPADRVATFVQVDRDKLHRHHDALMFKDGSIVLLTDLEPGQGAAILTVPVDPASLSGKERETAEETQRRAEYV